MIILVCEGITYSLLAIYIQNLLGICRTPFQKNTSEGLVLCFTSFVLLQVISNTFYWLAFIIYRPEFVDWSKTFLKVFFILWYIFRNNSLNAFCNWSTFYIFFQSLVKQMFVVIAEAVPHRCFSRKIIWSMPIINMNRNNFINNGQMSWGYFYFILFSFDQNLNSPKYGA